MNYRLKNIINLFFILALLISCSHKIEVKRFDGISKVPLNEETEICWEFGKADYVLIEGYNEVLPPAGCINVTPKGDKTLKFKAVSYFDTVNLSWEIQTFKTKRGLSDISNTYVSYEKSEFMVAKIESEKVGENVISQIKVMSYTKNENKISVNYILLDEFGNFVSGLNEANVKVISKDKEFFIESFREHNKSEKNFNIVMMIDNSYASENLDEYLPKIFEICRSLSEENNVILCFYNSLTADFISFPTLETIINYKLPDKNLNNLYLVMQNFLETFESDGDKENILINLAFSGDNSSMYVDAKDVSSSALEKKFKIYNVIVGTAANTSSFLYMSHFTGGRLYFLQGDDLDKFELIVNEILFSHYYYYTIEYTVDTIQSSSFRIEYSLPEKTLSDQFKVYFAPEDQYSDYQILALFDSKSIIIEKKFLPQLEKLAEIAKNNPNYTLEIIGYAEIEGNEEFTYKLAFNRAKMVAEFLIQNGVPKHQMRIVSEGSSKPIYFLPQKQWQKMYNRRVEIRWINPEKLPYEIIVAENYSSEKIASEKVQMWEQRAFKAYYERMLKNNMPYYRVKLWGFASKEEADKVLKNLKKKYKGNYEVR